MIALLMTHAQLHLEHSQCFLICCLSNCPNHKGFFVKMKTECVQMDLCFQFGETQS